MTTKLCALMFVALAVGITLPAHAAEYSSPPSTYFSNHNDDDDNDSFSSRYSSSVRRAVNRLDDDEVDHMPVPVLFVPYSRIYPDFGDPRGGGTREHEGQDIIAPLRSFVVSPTEAVVTRTGKGSSSGIYVYTAAPGGETFRYMHLDEIADGLRAGDELEPGDLIGYVGNTGNASGGAYHLHFEIRDGRRAQDPYPRLDGSFTNAEMIRALTNVIEVLREQIRNLQ